MKEELVRQEEFGGADKPTIYYVVGHYATINQHKLHIRVLVYLGFRVVAFEYSKQVLNGGKPQMVIDIIHEVAKRINNDKPDHRIAGVYGISLGVFIGLNAALKTNIQKMLGNSGAAQLTDMVWDNPYLAVQKAAFKKQGHTKASLQKAWGKYEVSKDSSKYKGMKLLFMNSKDDQAILYDNVMQALGPWRNQEIDMQMITFSRYKHFGAIVRNMFRINTTRKFIKT